MESILEVGEGASFSTCCICSGGYDCKCKTAHNCSDSVFASEAQLEFSSSLLADSSPFPAEPVILIKARFSLSEWMDQEVSDLQRHRGGAPPQQPKGWLHPARV